MSVSNPNLSVSRQDLADFYDKIFPYLGGRANAGFTPVGTIIHLMGVTAPANYLACDGTVYNISDYPELARYFGQQFSMVNKFGGDGTTTFAVPDLRGEFLRGTGTNSRTDCGSGASVGAHQEPTKFALPYAETSTIDVITSYNNNLYGIKSPDDCHAVGATTYKKVTVASSASSTWTSYSVRPTNTSVLYCIATKNIYMNPSLDYSTDEKVVGNWIDGSTLYQRTIVDTMPVIATDGTVAVKAIDISSWHLNECVSIEGMAYISNNFNAIDSCWNLSGAGSPQYFIRTNVGATNNVMSFQIRCNRSALSEANFYATLRYTKTTD